jgi:hypothetical protein
MLSARFARSNCIALTGPWETNRITPPGEAQEQPDDTRQPRSNSQRVNQARAHGSHEFVPEALAEKTEAF